MKIKMLLFVFAGVLLGAILTLSIKNINADNTITHNDGSAIPTVEPAQPTAVPQEPAQKNESQSAPVDSVIPTIDPQPAPCQR